jgi:hypothetical protein
MNKVDLSGVPTVITSYLVAHTARDAERAIASYTADAVVTDDGHTYHGPREIRAWLLNAASEYTYTVEVTGATTIDDTHFEVVQHLEGDFPGGVADLRYRFTLRDGAISRLEIAP